MKLIIKLLFLIQAGIFSANLNCYSFNNLDGVKITNQEMNSFIQAQMDTLNIVGLSVAVFERDDIVYSNSFGYTNNYTKELVNSETLFEAASLSKPVVSVFTLKLIEEGLIELDTPLHTILPFEEIYEDERFKDLTVEMVLNHTTGLPNWRWQLEGGELSFIEQPGEVFTYSGEAYVYLSKILAEITASNLTNLDSVFTQKITQPILLDDFYYGINEQMWSRMANGHRGSRFVHANSWDRSQFSAAGGLYSNPESYSKFIINLFDSNIISNESLELLLKNYIEVYPEYKELTGISEWGLGIGLIPSENGLTIAHGGNNFGYTAGFAYNIDTGFGFVVMTNSDQVSELVYALEDFLLPGIKSQ